VNILRGLPYPVAIVGTVIAILVAWLVDRIGARIINKSSGDRKERYGRRQALSTIAVISAITLIAILWARLLQHTGTFLGILGAGLAIALREPLLSIAGRIAIFAGHMYNVGDRIEINQMSGDVIDVGFFYTRIMEIGNWIGGDQYTGRIIQIANAQIFGTAVFNYTRSFAYIWDEIKLPVTYESNFSEASRLMKVAGEQYTKDFLAGAEKSVENMQRVFLVSEFELKPQVYLSFDSNYITLTMRYLVEPKKRRSARNFLFARILESVSERKDISFGSDTFAVSLSSPQAPDVKDVLKWQKEHEGRKSA